MATYNKLALDYLKAEAAADKQWAYNVVKTNPEYLQSATDETIKGVGRLLSMTVDELAKLSYESYRESPMPPTITTTMPTSKRIEAVIVALIKNT